MATRCVSEANYMVTRCVSEGNRMASQPARVLAPLVPHGATIAERSWPPVRVRFLQSIHLGCGDSHQRTDVGSQGAALTYMLPRPKVITPA